MESITQTNNYSISIPITDVNSQKSPKSFEDNRLLTTRQFGLTNNCFDPANSSPPNLFLKNLELRMSIYNYKKN
jgi:hypothetical protein